MGQSWSICFDGYDPAAEPTREALCTVGNGYLGTRGAAAESTAGGAHYPGTYAAGVYNRLEVTVDGRRIGNEDLVNLPNWLPVRFRVAGGRWFDVDEVELVDYQQRLDMRRALLIRSLVFRDADGRATSVVHRRFVHMGEAHLCASETTITPLDWSGALDVSSTIDTDVSNTLVDRYRDLPGRHLVPLRLSNIADGIDLAEVRTSQSGITVALAARSTIWLTERGAHARERLVSGAGQIGRSISRHRDRRPAASPSRKWSAVYHQPGPGHLGAR